MKFIEMFVAQGTIQRLSGCRLPIKTSYKLIKLDQAIDRERETYDKMYNDLRDKFAARKENGTYDFLDGGEIRVTPGKEEECGAALNELNNVDVTLPGISISLDELASVELSPEELLSLAAVIPELREE